MSDYYNCQCCGAFKPECVCWGTLTFEGGKSKLTSCTPETHRSKPMETETARSPNPKVRVPKWRLDYLNGIADQLGALGATQPAAVIREAAADLARAAGEFACIVNLWDPQMPDIDAAYIRVENHDSIQDWVKNIQQLGWVQ